MFRCNRRNENRNFSRISCGRTSHVHVLPRRYKFGDQRAGISHHPFLNHAQGQLCVRHMLCIRTAGKNIGKFFGGKPSTDLNVITSVITELEPAIYTAIYARKAGFASIVLSSTDLGSYDSSFSMPCSMASLASRPTGIPLPAANTLRTGSRAYSRTSCCAIWWNG